MLNNEIKILLTGSILSGESLCPDMLASQCAECENQQRVGTVGGQPAGDRFSDSQSSMSSPTRRASRASASQPFSGAAQTARAMSPRAGAGAGTNGAASLYDNGGKLVRGAENAAAPGAAAEERDRRLLMARHCDCDDCRALVTSQPPVYADPNGPNPTLEVAHFSPQLVSPYAINPLQLEQIQQHMGLQMGLQMPVQMQMHVPMPLSMPPLTFPQPPAGLTFNTLQLTRNPLQQLERDGQQFAAPAMPAAFAQMGTLNRRGSARISGAQNSSDQRPTSPSGTTNAHPLDSATAAAMVSQKLMKRSTLPFGNQEVSLLRRPLLGTGPPSRELSPSPGAVDAAEPQRQPAQVYSERSGSASGNAMPIANASLVRIRMPHNEASFV